MGHPPSSPERKLPAGQPPLPPRGARALVVGLGASGRSLARFLSSRGLRVRVCDLRAPHELGGTLAGLPPDAEAVLGGYDERALEGCAAVYASPGVPWDAPLLRAARARGMVVSSDVDLFLHLCPAPVVGVTGTNGKTTTTALVGAVLRQGPWPVVVAGNIGEPVLDHLDELTPGHRVVLELSSFQLEACAWPRVEVAVVLNITPDHLDRHGTMEAYVAAKARLVRFLEPTDHALLNGLDPVCRRLADQTRARVVWFDRHRPIPPVPMPGRHNQLNALAAAAVGRVLGLPDPAIEAAIQSFPGVEHRLELVAEREGVRWYNDSKATNPEAGLRGLEAFAGTPVVLIAGGHGSGFELGPWLQAIRAQTRAVVLIGASAALLEERLAGHPTRRAGSLEEAVATAAGLARSGDVVLLSPGYKSYDMFANYEERGRRFKAAVRAQLGLAADEPEPAPRGRAGRPR
ncbi:MAG TPA: UDP-N-acetylmuramoyl-L-alanine--D-glutamate ligase [Candidatus Dormibacteraeota bacterium]|nr:UDP-N-acetylmuramoyl-L-alanine--D-glutamate ligase [Candidatus Dormibacteraeota bacterium]